MKILYLHDFPLWGNGSANYLRNLVTQLSKQHKIAVLAPDPGKLEANVKRYVVRMPFPTPVFVGHPELSKSKKYSELTGTEITQLYKTYLTSTVRAVESFKPNIIHVNHFGPLTWIASYIRSIYNINFVATTHGSCLKNLEDNKRFLPLTRNSIYDAKIITTVSGHNKQWLLKLLGKDLRYRTNVVPCGINLKKFYINCDTSYIDKKYKMVNEHIALFVGRLTKEKGIEYIIRAADKIDGQIFIIGTGPEKQNLEKLNKELNNVNVHFIGYIGKKTQRELKDFYARADVFLSPSVCHEGLPLTILEAMSYLTPVVATRMGGIPLAVKQGTTGLFVKTRNVDDISEKVNQLFKDEKLRQRMGQQAKELIEKKFTWGKIALKFEKIYEDVIKGNGNGHEKKIVKNLELSRKVPKKIKPKLVKKSLIKTHIKATKKLTKKLWPKKKTQRRKH